MKRNFYWILVVGLLLTFAVGGYAQGNYAWTNLGPDNLGSITRALAYDSQGNLLAGSQGGGLWRSSTQGSSWERVSSYDAVGNPNITSIAVDGNTIYVATGATAFVRSYFVSDLNFNSNYDYRDLPEGFKGYLKGLPGGGIYVSTNGGGSWTPAAATNTAETRNYKGPFGSIQKVSVDGGKVFVATAEGLYISTDGLQTLAKASGSTAFETSIVFDVEVSGNGNIFAGTHNPASTIDDSLYMSTDGGNSFSAVADADFFTNGKFSFNGMRIAVSPSDPDILYVGTTSASQGLNGIYRSNDNGGNWFRYGPQGGPGFRPLNRDGRDAFILEVFPDNSNELIVAGNSWYTFREGDGWTQTAQHTNPTASNYITRNMYSLVFEGDQTMFIGTDQQIIRSTDRGETFSQQSKGYEAMVAYSVTAITAAEQNAVVAGTPNDGVVYNGLYDTSLPSRQGYASISTSNYGEVAASYLHPGAIISQGTDDGIIRSLNAGGAFERFYGQPLSPQVAGLSPANSDTIIDRPNASSEGGQLFNSGGAAQTPFVLDEVIPDNLLDANIPKEDLREQAEAYIFFASRQYVWIVNGALGDGLQVKWNRVSNQLVNGINEFLSAMAVSGDSEHTVWVSSTNGGLWRINRPHDLANFDASTDVTQINTQPSGGLTTMNGRWLSSITVDPQDSDRVVVTYAGYGGDNNTVQSFIFMTETASTAPQFAPITGFPTKEPIYSSKFVVDPASGESVLLVGAESGLYSVTGINSVGPIFLSTWTNEFGTEFGKIPVYDIDVRLYKSQIYDEDTQDFSLSRDNTVFVATHGRGIWSTSALTYPRVGNSNPTLDIEQLSAKIFPNPNQGRATMQVELTEDGTLEFALVDINGRRLSQQNTEVLAAGRHELPLDLSQLSPGIYFVEMKLATESSVLQRTLKTVITR